MKKKKILIPLPVILCLLCMLALVACEKTPADDDIAQTEQSGTGDNTPSAHVHAFGDWSVTVPASCSAGEETRSCSCGAKETCEIAASGVHNVTAANGCTCTGCSKKYMYLGEYPQTLKAEGVTVDEAQQDARGYYLGSDNAYYAKFAAPPMMKHVLL